jgi:hypothetical protein
MTQSAGKSLFSRIKDDFEVITSKEAGSPLKSVSKPVRPISPPGPAFPRAGRSLVGGMGAIESDEPRLYPMASLPRGSGSSHVSRESAERWGAFRLPLDRAAGALGIVNPEYQILRLMAPIRARR